MRPRFSKHAEGSGAGAGTGDTYVSSLFTHNPEATTVQETAVEEEHVPQEASNAPIADATNFEGLGIDPFLTKHLSERMSMTQPTKIQRAVIPRLLTRQRDLFVQAQTGSGKTLAYSLPVINQLMSCKGVTRDSGLFAVILTPTRELATQIYGVLEELVGCCRRIVPGIVIGGEKKKSEKARLRKGVNILVATPGRLADHMDNTEVLDLSMVRWVILDEGDRLTELGFEETITKILTTIEEKSKISRSISIYPELPSRRVTLLCSATMKDEVKQLGEQSLEDGEWVNNETVPDKQGDINDSNVLAPAQLVSEYLIVPAKLRLVTLAAALKKITLEKPESRIIVFFSCSDSVDFHFSVFTRDGKDPRRRIVGEDGEVRDDIRQAPASEQTVLSAPLLGENAVIHKLHGSLSQQIRTSTLNAFSDQKNKAAYEAKPSILFCTDVASRGLDLPLITDVIEFDPPFSTDDHVHRIGRTARAGKNGHSCLFVLPGKEEGYLELIKPFHPSGFFNKDYKELLAQGFGKEWDVTATTWHLDVERWIINSNINASSRPMTLARNGFQSHIRAYATHLSTERSIFNVRDLHLGHIAKSFGLRETPGKLGGAMGKDKKNGDQPEKKIRERKVTKNGAVNEEYAKRKMNAVANQHMSTGAEEFNIGYQ
ncbi:DEAD-domain-containing protein [Nadsonia fulvescens var. elongata DSM 6958]|uniref:ATP-dependent RNA helicase n=1 Tax=Nadsonia fulvescens var. elongata DSM 6958 TaxID=857566 RepID=A0A1E3PLN8_9ASCO|nr:DEAD-domain-containing protein [Nadsonia fulvescens var. elongata DSM 6958]